MPRFLYRAKSTPVNLVEGMVEAEDLRAAVAKVSQLGLMPVDVQPESPTTIAALAKSFRRPVSGRWLAISTRQLSDLLESGLTMLSALRVICQQTPSERLKNILEDVAGVVKGGGTLSDGLDRYPHVFSRLYVALVRAGESSGALEEVLRRLADSLEAEEELKAKIWTALTYPFFLSGVGLLTIGVLLGVVIPRLVTMFSEMGQLLPLPTRMILYASQLLSHYGWFFLILLIFGWFSFRGFIHRPEGKMLLDSFLLRVPVVGRLIVQAEIARFGRTLGTLLGQGVPMLQSLGIVRETLVNELLRQDLRMIQQAVQAGASMSQATQSAKNIPSFVQNFISIGETGGRLDQALTKVATSYEREVDRTVKVLTTLLEPALILFMGLIVGGIVMAMLLPIFQLNLMVR